ncbi:volume-regulated anion channel subunit LRRC8D-like [Aplochiton taeniatus]
MFSLSDVTAFGEIEPTYRILKPWWDVFMDYITVVMLMLSIFAGTMQIYKDQVVCLPFHDAEVAERSGSHTTQPPLEAVMTKDDMIPRAATSHMNKDLPESVTHQAKFVHHPDSTMHVPEGIRNNLDFQQYVFISQLCYHIALPWFSKYFPYLALFHTVILMVSSNFWFKYPKTSSKIEHFVSILGKCFESQWTTKALSETACEHTEETKQRLSRASTLPKHLSTCSADGSPLQTEPVVSRSGVKFTVNPNEVVPVMTVLDKKDNEQAKALFEKVRKLRNHIEDSDLIYKFCTRVDSASSSPRSVKTSSEKSA